MKIHENFYVKGIFHHKSNRMKVYTCICLVSLFFRFVELFLLETNAFAFRLVSAFISNS